ncbi:MAG: hypothetical protein D6730_14855 [Bacteroidetes bacterium]|nr:MAG: hypothetical protein D6730_14855 [Bacteroidota bacterium]
MTRNNLIFVAFAAMVLLQLFVPAYMIVEQENVIKKGKAFKFRTAPIDPSDPFRGKYITLSFEDDRLLTADWQAWEAHEDAEVYLELETDSAGFARIRQVHLSPPAHTQDYFRATLYNVYEAHQHPGMGYLHFRFPFNRFYMEESKAGPAEQLYREAGRQPDSTEVYAVVYVRSGKAVVAEVMLNGLPIKEAVAAQQKEE